MKNPYIISKEKFKDSIVNTLSYFSQADDYDRLHRTFLFFLVIADNNIDLSDKVYTRPKDNVDDWENYFFNFRRELEEHKLMVLHFHKDLPMREVILHALLMVSFNWTCGNS